jgi:uncharacterized Ntn-hydrolase superfamily protein
MTFSIVAWDGAPEPPEWGVAVASKFLAVGAAVPWASAESGAIATQALANLAYGPDGLALLKEGVSADEVVSKLTGADAESAHRQLGVVDLQGRAATYTGSECLDWAGGIAGDGFCCQGNILVGPQVVERMAEAFQQTEGELAARLLAALRAGDDAGGDRRGRQSASLYVVREGAGYGGTIDRAVDLRVDDHPLPVKELAHLFEQHRLLFPRAEDLDFVPIDENLASELRMSLAELGYESSLTATGYDSTLRDALYAYAGTENLEERWSDDAAIEKGVLFHIRRAITRR